MLVTEAGSFAAQSAYVDDVSGVKTAEIRDVSSVSLNRFVSPAKPFSSVWFVATGTRALSLLGTLDVRPGHAPVAHPMATDASVEWLIILEQRHQRWFRVEVGADYHHWAVHDQILVEPEDIVLTDIPGFPKEYALPAISIERGFQGTVGARIGAEYSIKATDDVEVTPRAGFSYETSAVPAEYQSLLLLDAGKATPSVGLGVQFGNARFDVVYAHQFYPSVEVAPEDAKLPQTLPLQANAPDRPDYINGGIYNWGVDVVGLGFQYTFDKGAPAVEDEEAVTPAPAPKPKGEPPSEEE